MTDAESKMFNSKSEFEDAPHVFPNVNLIHEWGKREKEFWNWIQNSGVRGNARTPINQTMESINQLVVACEQHCDANDSDAKKRARKEITTSLEAITKSGLRLTSSHPLSHFAKSIAEKDPTEASHTILALTNPNVVPIDHIGIKGHIAYSLFRNGVSGQVVANLDASIDADREKWNDLHNDAVERHTKVYSESTNLLDVLGKKSTEHSEKFHVIQKDAVDRLEAIEKTYDEKLALQAPTTYWEKKKANHNWWSKLFGCAFAIACGLAVLAVWAEFEFWIRPNMLESQVLSASVDLDSGDTVQGNKGPTFAETYLPFAVLLASASFLIWPLTLISRRLLSHIHLASDADERVTMSQTYLSLLRSEAGLPDDDRTLILNALFRPSATGIVKDDAAPPSLAILINKLLGK